MRKLAVLLLCVYSLCLLYVEWTKGQVGVRPYVTDITGPVRFYAIHTSLSVGLLAASAGLNLLILGLARRVATDWRTTAFHAAQAGLFAYLACDDRFLIHEELGMRLGIEDALILVALGLLELGLLAWLGRLRTRSPRARHCLALAGVAFAAMLVVDGTFPSEWRFRLSAEDLFKLWGGALLLLFHLELYEEWLVVLAGKAARPQPPGRDASAAPAWSSALSAGSPSPRGRLGARLQLRGPSARLLLGLVALIACLATLHTVSEVLVYTGHLSQRLQLYVDMDHEGNLPAWVSGVLLFSCALVCWCLAALQPGSPHTRGNSRGLWLVGAAGFALLSCDEIIQLHEVLEGNYFGLGLASHWYVYLAPIAIPFGAFALALAWRALAQEPHARRLVTVGVVLFLVASIGFESLRGLFDEGALLEGVGEAMLLQIVLEESSELLAVSLMLVGLLETLQLRSEVPRPPADASWPLGPQALAGRTERADAPSEELREAPVRT